jgi:hypothetical protein
VRDTQTNLVKGNVRLYLDGQAISASAFSYSLSTDRLRYTPKRNLSYGTHTVRVVAKDSVGNTASRSWKFKIVR